MVSLTWLAHTSKLSERVKVAMGVCRNFSKGDATSTFCLSRSGCWRYNANGCSQNALLLLHHKENAPWKHALRSHLIWNIFHVELYRPVARISQREGTKTTRGCHIFKKCEISFDWTLTPSLQTNGLKWLDSSCDSTKSWLASDPARKNFRWLRLERLVTLSRQKWLGHNTALSV